MPLVTLPLPIAPLLAPAIARQAPADFRYLYFWHRMDRKGQACAVLARGTMNSCLVQFQDGIYRRHRSVALMSCRSIGRVKRSN